MSTKWLRLGFAFAAVTLTTVGCGPRETTIDSSRIQTKEAYEKELPESALTGSKPVASPEKKGGEAQKPGADAPAKGEKK